MVKKILLVGHVTPISGPGHHLRDYLVSLPSVKTYVVFHPMIGSNLPSSVVTFYDGKKPKILTRIPRPSSLIRQLVFEAAVSLWQIIETPGKIDLYIGINNFDTLPGLLFKGWKIKKVVYYGSDYSDVRFTNPILNLIYRFVERLDLLFADLVVSNTYRAQAARVKRGLTKDRSLVVPNGVDLSSIPAVKKKSIYKFVFQGYLSKTHGIIETIVAMRKIVKKYPGTKIAVIGYGPEETMIKKYVTKNKLEKNVVLIGRLSHANTLRFLREKCQVGIASYNLTDGWTKYCSPLKVKEYLACGLAVIISSVPEVSRDIESFKMGLVYSSTRGLYKAMLRFCDDRKFIKQCVSKSQGYIKDYDWNLMYKKYLLPRMF